MKPFLLVLLHGVGADAASFGGVARFLERGLPDVAVVVPDGFHPFDGGSSGRQWFSLRGITEANRPARVRVAGAEVSQFADAELTHRGWGRERIAFVGFSQGAIVAAWLAVHRRPPPAAVVMMAGRLADDTAPVAGAVSTPVFIAHGDRDAVIPVSVVEPSARGLAAWGAQVTTRVYPGLAHDVGEPELRDVLGFLTRTLS